MADLLSSLINPIQQGFQRFINPQIPQAQASQRGETPSTYPGYQKPVAPPPTVDMAALGRMAQGVGNTLSRALQGPLARPQFSSQNVRPTASPTAAPLLSQPTASPTPTPMMNVANPDQSNIDWLETNVLPYSRSYGYIPDELVAGQWAIEDRQKNTSMFNLLFNGKKHSYQNYKNNVDDYVRTVTNILRDKGYDIKTVKDAKRILEILQDTSGRRYEGHSKDPSEYVRITTDTPEYKYYAGRKK